MAGYLYPCHCVSMMLIPILQVQPMWLGIHNTLPGCPLCYHCYYSWSQWTRYKKYCSQSHPRGFSIIVIVLNFHVFNIISPCSKMGQSGKIFINLDHLCNNYAQRFCKWKLILACKGWRPFASSNHNLAYIICLLNINFVSILLLCDFSKDCIK